MINPAEPGNSCSQTRSNADAWKLGQCSRCGQLALTQNKRHCIRPLSMFKWEETFTVGAAINPGYYWRTRLAIPTPSAWHTTIIEISLKPITCDSQLSNVNTAEMAHHSSQVSADLIWEISRMFCPLLTRSRGAGR